MTLAETCGGPHQESEHGAIWFGIVSLHSVRINVHTCRRLVDTVMFRHRMMFDMLLESVVLRFDQWIRMWLRKLSESFHNQNTCKA